MKHPFFRLMIAGSLVGSVLAQDVATPPAKAEAPKAEAAVAEPEAVPVAEKPVAEAPKAEEPKVEAPKEEKPAAPVEPAPAPKEPEDVPLDPAPFSNMIDKISYAIGMQMAAGIEKQGLKLNADLFGQGFKEQSGGAAKITAAEASEALFAWQKQRMKEHREKMKADATKNEAAGLAFRETNKAKEGVVETDSGLQYEIVKAAEGDKPTVQDTVTINYAGTFTDGSVYKSEKAVSYPVSKMFRGWAEGLQLMNVGSSYRLVVPAGLAFGEAGSPPPFPGGPQDVGPNATLIFDIDLVSIEGKIAAPVTGSGE
jgi:FKBP-type peptidyl-prolyl cis-trans isomerase